ncbi:MAG: glycine cleavage system aminomethyltransferase GcvT [Candidatus Binatia bacterium]
MGRRTPLYDVHRALGARCVEFAGWDMPVAYDGPLEEHHAVRRQCGLFDVSHMGEVELHGPGAEALCQRLTVNDTRRLGLGDAQYNLLCNDDGGVLDDLLVYRLEAERFLLVVNAGGIATDVAWIRRHAGADVAVEDRSDATALLALQGPEAEAALRSLTPLDLRAVRPFTARRALVGGVDALVSRTGYTGEDGFEIFVDAGAAVVMWDGLLAAARRRGGRPAGLAARDTLRLEAGLPLYGSDMDATSSPLEAGLGWVVKLDKGPFIGRERAVRETEAGVRRRLVGLELDEAGIARHGFAVWHEDERVGDITSGAKSPTLGSFIAMAYVRADVAAVGTRLAVEIRGRRVPARVTRRPFYRRPVRQEE